MPDLEARFRPRGERIAHEVIDGEAIVIDLSTGVYYSMNGVGAGVWTLIEQRHSVAEITDALRDAYDEAPGSIEDDVRKLIGELLAEDLIVARQDRPAPKRAAALPTQPPSYHPPVLEIYRDMEDLLALDPPLPDLKDKPWS